MKKILVLIMALMIGLSFGCTSVPHTSIHTKKERITGTRVTNNCSVPVLVGYVAAYKNKPEVYDEYSPYLSSGEKFYRVYLEGILIQPGETKDVLLDMNEADADSYETYFFPADKWCCCGWILQRIPGYMRAYKLTDSEKYCLNVEIVNNLTKIEPLNNYLMD